jgi:hypothetical protein
MMDDNQNDRRWMWALPFTILAVILLSFATYQWIIPRTNLEIRTVYHEAPGGGGTGGTIHVNVLFTNAGNREISDLESIITVSNAEGGVLARHTLVPTKLEIRKNVEVKLILLGSHYEEYRISISLDFVSSGDSNSNSLTYNTAEDVMTLVFVENIR